MNKRNIFRSLFLCFLFFSSACAHVYTAHGVYHRVQQGETLGEIAQKYKVETQDLAEANNIESAEGLKVGRSLYIPGATVSGFTPIIERERIREKRLAQAHPSKARYSHKKRVRESSLGPAPSITTDHDRFIWPITGELSSTFGPRHKRHHDGIDIRTRRGSPVKAAADGEVVYSQRMKGYGNLILLKHEDDFFTVYAHNSVNLVKKGSRVKKGQLISKVGSTGRATGPHLHFEVREGTKARNPLFFLPKSGFVTKKEKETQDGEHDTGGPEEENP